MVNSTVNSWPLESFDDEEIDNSHLHYHCFVSSNRYTGGMLAQLAIITRGNNGLLICDAMLTF